MASPRTPSLKKDLLTELGGDELSAIGGAGTDTCACLTGHHPTVEGSCLCTGPCDWSRLC